MSNICVDTVNIIPANHQHVNILNVSMLASYLCFNLNALREQMRRDWKHQVMSEFPSTGSIEGQKTVVNVILEIVCATGKMQVNKSNRFYSVKEEKRGA